MHPHINFFTQKNDHWLQSQLLYVLIVTMRFKSVKINKNPINKNHRTMNLGAGQIMFALFGTVAKKRKNC